MEKRFIINNKQEKKFIIKHSSLSEVPAIEGSRNEMIDKREQIKDIVEQPLIEACEDMYKKNIRTLSTSANEKDIKRGEAHIIIDFDSLSEENQKIAEQYAKPADYDGSKAVKIIIQVTEKTTPDEITREANKIADAFQMQPAVWIPKYTLEDLKKVYGINPEETKYDDPSVWENYYYNPKEKVFYRSEEHYKKANKGLE